MRAIVVACIAVLTFGCAKAPPPGVPGAAPPSVRDTDAGPVVGFHDRYDTHAWLGIPYAAPPVGPLRWRAPQPAAPRTTPLQALQFGAVCPQFHGFGAETPGRKGELVGAEDCLTLNVWAPAMDAPAAATAKLPVMLWIHGGGNAIGTSRSYPGYHLAADQRVVVVTINFRLNILGWFSHAAIRETAANPEDASGNFGTLDMIAALRWVRQNIAAFGGDPGNVTIFGESGGGQDVYVLMASAPARGLFHKAIVQSGFATTDPLAVAEHFADDPAPGDAYSSAEILARQLVAEGRARDRAEARGVLAAMSAADLLAWQRAKPLADLYAGSYHDPAAAPEGLIITPHHVRDGTVVPQEPLLERFRNPDLYAHVPLISGTTRDEGTLSLVWDPTYVRMAFGKVPMIRDRDRFRSMARYISDTFKALSVDEVLPILAASQREPVFAYRFDWDEWPYAWMTWPVDLTALMGAAHGLDVGYVFGDVGGVVSSPMAQSRANEAGRLALRKAMMSYWGNFAHTGMPGRGRDGRQPEWTPWQASGNRVMLLDTPAAGGPRMSDASITAQDIKRRILEDPSLPDQASRCRLYAQLFLTGMQIDDFFDAGEYATFGEPGCAQFPPEKFGKPFF
ncbi:MAG TPA: carboxylesterase family protein [Nevskiaceae bacterium]|nr:carboxylesterase family protein [Nevskiaceae bacterium]